MPNSAALFLLACCGLYAAAIPRPEYPQPQFQRDRWLSLNGSWDFEFDDANAGLDADWASGSHKFSRNITVPYCFESRLSGIADTSFHPWVWYRRAVTLPAEWKGRRVLLHFGAVNYWSMVWVNGKLAGSHEGGNTPFTFDVTPLLQPGANGRHGARPLPAHGSLHPPRQAVLGAQIEEYLLYPHQRHLAARVDGACRRQLPRSRQDHGPSKEARVRLEFGMRGPQPDLEVTAVGQMRGPVAAATAAHQGRARHALLSIDEPKLWSPSSPNLYDLVLELRRGAQVLDRVQTYFGIRTRHRRKRQGAAERRPHLPEDGARPGLLAREHPDAAHR